MLYAAMIEDLDANVGRLLDTLHSLGLEDRTLVMFMSDNGGILQSHDPDRAGKMSTVKMFMTLLEQYREFSRHPD